MASFEANCATVTRFIGEFDVCGKATEFIRCTYHLNSPIIKGNLLKVLGVSPRWHFL